MCFKKEQKFFLVGFGWYIASWIQIRGYAYFWGSGSGVRILEMLRIQQFRILSISSMLLRVFIKFTCVEF